MRECTKKHYPDKAASPFQAGVVHYHAEDWDEVTQDMLDNGEVYDGDADNIVRIQRAVPEREDPANPVRALYWVPANEFGLSGVSVMSYRTDEPDTLMWLTAPLAPEEVEAAVASIMSTYQ